MKFCRLIFLLMFFTCFSVFATENINILIQEYKSAYSELINAEAQQASEFAIKLLQLKDSKEYEECASVDEYSIKCDVFKNLLKQLENDRLFKRKSNSSLLKKLNVENRLIRLGTLELQSYTTFLNESFNAIFFEVDVKYSKSQFDLIPRNCTKHPITCQLDLRYKIINSTVQEKLSQFEIFMKQGLDNYYQENECNYGFFTSNAKPLNKSELERFSKLMFTLHENYILNPDLSLNEKYRRLRGPYLKTNAFQLKILGRNNENRICTATHVKINKQCSLLTNEHCIQNIENPQITLITGEENEPGTPSRQIKVKIKKSSPDSELVLLEPPDYFNSQYCERLLETKVPKPEEMVGEYKSLHIAGFTRNGEVDIKYNYQTDDPTLKDKKPTARLLPSGLRGVSHFVEIKYIDVGPGMSGGPLLDDKGNVLGITTRYLPFEDTPWIIPIHDVAAFIAGQKITISKNPSLFSLSQYKASATPFITGDNLPKKPGDNLPKKPGDNLPKKPGDNLPKKPGDNLPKKPGDNLPKKPSNNEMDLSIFLDKPEGVIDFNDPQRRKLLAVRCDENSLWEQIDGNDDYIHKCPDVTKLSESDKIYADQNFEIPANYKTKVLDILSGNYDYNNSSYSGRKIVYIENSTAIDQMRKVNSQLQRDQISISPQQIKLILGKDKKLDFEIKIDEEGRIYLHEDSNETLICDSKSITKLICYNSNITLTLSMINSKNKELKYRISIKEKSNIEYYYGTFINKK